MGRTLSILAIWLIAVITAITTSEPLYDQIAYVVTFTIGLSYLWARASIRSVELVRRAPSRRAQVGRYIEEQFVLRNTGLMPKLWVEVRDLSDLPGHRPSRVVNSLGPRRQFAWTMRTLCRQRGRYQLGPAELSGGDAFGLFRMTRRTQDSTPVVIYPYTADLPGFLLRGGELPGGDALRRRTHHVTTNVSGVRDYQPGDSFNRIHWRSTARTGRLIVKEFELDPTADVWLFPDMHTQVQVGSATPFGERQILPALLQKELFTVLEPVTEEYAVSVAASLGKHFLAHSRAVGLAAQGQHREFLQPDRGERQLSKLMETLAVIRAWGRVPLAQMLAAEGMNIPRGSSLVAITPSIDLEWVQVLGHLRRRGLRAVAVHIVPSTFGEAPDSEPLLAQLALHEIPTYVVRKDEPLEEALSEGRDILEQRAV